MNLPNKLTLSRIFLTIVFLFILRLPGWSWALLATAVFALAALTDYYDGYFAKKYHLVSDFGKLMDPIADKFLVLAAFLVFLRMNIVEDWMVIVILAREISVTGLRVFALTKKRVLAAEKAGKHKTVSQMVVIFVILGFLVFKRFMVSIGGWSPEADIFWKTGIDIAMLVTVALTLYSGLIYFWNNRKLIRTQ